MLTLNTTTPAGSTTPDAVGTDLHAHAMPMALRDLHREMDVGDTAQIEVHGVLTGSDSSDGPPPTGRSPTGRTAKLVRDVVVGAGFSVFDSHTISDRHAVDRSGTAGGDGSGAVGLRVRVRRLDTLADTVGPGMRLLLVGLNPSPHAAASGVGFSGPSNRGWPALLGSGLATVDRDPVSLLRDHRIGMTDLVKRTTRRASELTDHEYRAGMARLERLCAWLRPGAVCVIGLTGWRAATGTAAPPGHQTRPLGGRPVWLMPNPSGLNAHVTLDALVHHLQAAAELAGDPG